MIILALAMSGCLSASSLKKTADPRWETELKNVKTMINH